MVLHRSITDGFKVKTGTVIREADGWYISLTLEDKDVPVTVSPVPTVWSPSVGNRRTRRVAEIQPTEENSIGIDLGVQNYVTLKGV